MDLCGQRSSRSGAFLLSLLGLLGSAQAMPRHAARACPIAFAASGLTTGGGVLLVGRTRTWRDTQHRYPFQHLSSALDSEPWRTCGRIWRHQPGRPSSLGQTCMSSVDEQELGPHEQHQDEQWRYPGGERGGSSRASFVQTAAGSAAAVLALSLAPKTASAAVEQAVDMTWTPVNVFEKSIGVTQDTYSPRFVAYLARFLLNYDSVSAYWWRNKQVSVSQGSAQEFAKKLVDQGADAVFKASDLDGDGTLNQEEFSLAIADQQMGFAKFEASVNFGLRKYQGKSGIKKLFNLLVEEFGEETAGKRQIALLFALLDSNQPVENIKALMGETDNSSVVSYKVTNGGRGYEAGRPPAVKIESPPFMTDAARATTTLTRSGSVFRVALRSPGKGYETAPAVTISPPRDSDGVTATAVAALKGGKVVGIVVTNGGSGYTEDDDVKVTIEQPDPESAGSAVAFVEGRMNCAAATAVMDMKVSEVRVVHKGSGYASTLPAKVTIDPPPPKLEYALPGTTAEAEAMLSAPPEKEVLRSWLPPQQLRREVTELLPDNLVPMLDPCLAKFYLSPIEVADPNYCVYFDNAEFQVYPSQKLARYFSFLDGPRTRYPVEKERPLDAGVFLRFAACGAACGSTAHAFLIPIDVVKTRMQSEPKKYPDMVSTFGTLVKEEGVQAFLLGTGATIVGYLFYGGVSFGLTEYLKRRFVELAGPDLAALYPIPILLGASAISACFAATAVTPFETLRIKTVTVPNFPKTLAGAMSEMVSTGRVGDLVAGVPVLLLAEIPFMMAKFATFDAFSKLAYSIFPQATESVAASLAVSLISGMVAGVAASLVSQPSDTVFVEVSDKDMGSANILDTVKDVYKEGGVGAFYKGALPRAAKSALNIALQFFLYDSLKRLASVAPDDLKVFFDVMSGLEMGAKNGGRGANVTPTVSKLIDSAR
eukprot:g9855.t1